MPGSPADLSEVLVLESTCHRDARGFFIETWHQARHHTLGLPETMPQDNVSWSARNVLRGLHFQHPNPQAKLVQVLVGEVFDVVVDVRRGSPNFGRWKGMGLSAASGQQLYIPVGFAHGFYVLSDGALVTYKCSALYDPDCEQGIAWDDASLAIPWPVTNPILSAKDERLARLRDLSDTQLPGYERRV